MKTFLKTLFCLIATMLLGGCTERNLAALATVHSVFQAVDDYMYNAESETGMFGIEEIYQERDGQRTYMTKSFGRMVMRVNKSYEITLITYYGFQLGKTLYFFDGVRSEEDGTITMTVENFLVNDYHDDWNYYFIYNGDVIFTYGEDKKSWSATIEYVDEEGKTVTYYQRFRLTTYSLDFGSETDAVRLMTWYDDSNDDRVNAWNYEPLPEDE